MQKLDLGAQYEPDAQPEVNPAAPEAPVVRKPMAKSNSPLPIVIAVIAVVAGLLTGVGAHQLQSKTGPTGSGGGGAPVQEVAGDNVKNGDIFGSESPTYKDSAEGYLEIGGLDGEGSHRLLRAGGESQTVYLVSSATDLSKFDGMQVKVWGETNKGQKVGWLMEVGKVQVLNTQGEKPAAK